MNKITFLLLFFFSTFMFSQTQIGNDIDGKSQTDQIGWSTSFSADGTIVAVGASGVATNLGYVQVLKFNNGNWQQLGNDIVGDTAGDYFGHAVSLSDDGTILAVSAYNYSDSNTNFTSNNYGLVKVFKYENDTWSQLGSTIFERDRYSSSSKDQDDLELGYSLDLNADGTVLVVGAPKADLLLPIHADDIPNCGLVEIYKFQNNDWSNYRTIFGEAEEDNSGNSVSLSSDGNIVAIGASNKDGNGSNSGHVRIYDITSGSPIQLGEDINGEAAFDLSGWSVSLSDNGTVLAIGATTNDGTDTDAGHVRVFEYQNNMWSQLGEDINGEAAVDQFGYSVSLSNNGTILVSGSIDNDGNDFKSGHARVFEYQNNNWVQKGTDIDGEASGDQSGFSVSISGDGTKVAVGAPFNDGNGGNSGHVRVYDLSAVLSSDSFVLSKFSISPNPTKNLVTIQLKDNLKLNKLSIYNSLGQFVKSSRELSINTSKLSKGVYFLQVETNLGSASKKLIIE